MEDEKKKGQQSRWKSKNLGQSTEAKEIRKFVEMEQGMHPFHSPSEPSPIFFLQPCWWQMEVRVGGLTSRRD